MSTPTNRYSKALRMLELERLICSTILEKRAFPSSEELAQAVGVTPRTIRNYFKERRLRMWGPEKIWLRLEDEQGREVGKPANGKACRRRSINN
jgi:transcriptional antiterminator